MIRLGFNLYNGFDSGSVVDTFSDLNETNYKVAMKAINARFDR